MRFGAENPETSSGKAFLEPRQSASIQDQLVQPTIILDSNAYAVEFASLAGYLLCCRINGVVVHAILDLRRDPAQIRKRFTTEDTLPRAPNRPTNQIKNRLRSVRIC